MHHNWFNVQFSRCILWIPLSRNSMKQAKSFDLICFSQFLVVESTGIEPVTSCLQGRRSPSWANPPYRVNAECIMHNAELLAFILHSSFWILHLIKLKWWAKMDSNHRPHDYQSCALASWAIGPSCLHFKGISFRSFSWSSFYPQRFWAVRNELSAATRRRLCPLNWIT